MSDAFPRPDEEDEEELEPSDGGPRVGDVVVIPYARLRAQLRAEPEAGLIVEDRRSVTKVLFPAMDRTFWLERDQLRVVPEGRLALHPLVAMLHDVARIVDADLIEEYERQEDVAVFHVHTRRLDMEILARVHERMGEDLRRLRIAPAGMRRLKLDLAFRVPDARSGP